MLNDPFLLALQKTTAGGLSVAELVGAAGTLAAAGQTAQAQQLYAVWIKFNPEHPHLFVALFNSASLSSQPGGDIAGAIDCLNRAIAQNPEFLPAYINLGGLLERSGSLDKAVEQWKLVTDRLSAVTAGSVGYKVAALKQIGRVFSEHRQSAPAEAALRECLALDSHQSDVAGQLLGLRMAQCKWPAIEPYESVDRATLMTGFLPLSMTGYTDDPLLQLACASRYIEQASQPLAPYASDRRNASIDAGRRLRIGYVSSDLRDHAIGYLMAEVFELHDKSKVEVFAYYCGSTRGDVLSRRIQAAVEHWVDIRDLSDDQAAARIAADEIDILVDVNGHTKDARTSVFARRPAPVQVNWLGYPGTMGSPYHHYLIADGWIIPPEHELYYSEKVVRLPCYQPNDRKRVVAPERPTRSDAGLPDDAMVFCSFNASHKVGRFTFDRWIEILSRVPDSVLWLIASDEGTHERLKAYAAARGVAPERLVFAPKQHNPQHLARYALADLFLDTVPYGAHTTASDALWMGVPVLTLSGRSFASRVCGSLVRAAGLPELVCATPEEYVERAVTLGSDRSALAAHRVRLQFARHSCILFDMETLVSRLEELYRGMALDHSAGHRPEPDLSNLKAYFDVGVAMDHEAREMLAVGDYHGLYREALARRHLARPLQPDTRLWTAEEIAAIERPADEKADNAWRAMARVVGG